VKKPSGAEYRERRTETEHEFEECKKKTINLQKYFTSKSAYNETRK
jgi:hypothetical protein